MVVKGVNIRTEVCTRPSATGGAYWSEERRASICKRGGKKKISARWELKNRSNIPGGEELDTQEASQEKSKKDYSKESGRRVGGGGGDRKPQRVVAQ